MLTVFGFIAQPETHIFLKPNVTRIAAQEYGFDFQYQSRPSWKTYANFLRLAETMRRDLRELQPRDMIDLQSFIWVLGSDEYEVKIGILKQCNCCLWPVEPDQGSNPPFAEGVVYGDGKMLPPTF